MKLVYGAVSGLLATAVMTVVILGAKAAGLFRTPPPKEITGRAGAQAGGDPSAAPQPVFDLTWIAAHAGFGMVGGAAFALLRWGLPKSTTPAGVLYGSAIWVANYLGIMPALGLYPWPDEDSNARTAVMIAAHLVYGVTLAQTQDLLAD